MGIVQLNLLVVGSILLKLWQQNIMLGCRASLEFLKSEQSTKQQNCSWVETAVLYFHVEYPSSWLNIKQAVKCACTEDLIVSFGLPLL